MAKKISEAMHVVMNRIESARKDGVEPQLQGYRRTVDALLRGGLIERSVRWGYVLTDAGRLARYGAPVSYAPEVVADASGSWCGNALRFATREEAEKNVRDLSWRWLLVRDTRVVTSQDPVNYRWDDARGLVAVEPAKEVAGG